MGTSNSFDEAGRKMERAVQAVAKLPKTVGNPVGRMGRGEVLRLAVDVFGGDRKFSGAARSRKARRQASSSFKTFGDRVEVYPTGDPFYIFMKGRGRHVIRPRRRGSKGVRLPDGGVRRSVLGGRLAPRPNLLEPAERRIRVEAPKVVAKALHAELNRVF